MWLPSSISTGGGLHLAEKISQELGRTIWLPYRDVVTMFDFNWRGVFNELKKVELKSWGV